MQITRPGQGVVTDADATEFVRRLIDREIRALEIRRRRLDERVNLAHAAEKLTEKL